MNFQYYRRGYRKIKERVKLIIRTKTGRKVIKISLLTYDISRVVYNPFYLLDIVKRTALNNLLI
mgnify:FL=1